MANLQTREDYTITVFEVQPAGMRSTITIPAGTRVIAVDDPMGMAFAVDDIRLVVRLTGNNHDPYYRYVFVPAHIVGSAA